MEEPFGEDSPHLLRRAARGDEDAWSEVVRRYAPRVFGVIYSQCRDAHLAEEIVQSALCSVAEHLGRYVEAGKFQSWLFRIATNRLRDEIRRRSIHAAPTDPETFDWREGDAEAGAGYRTVDPETLSALDKAVGQLGPADREIIEYRHTAGMSFREISELLGEPVGTLLARHHRALAKLRALLGEDEG